MARSICVFCGSRFGARPSYREAARRLGALCGRHGIELVYGGGHVGLMGVVADAAIGGGGRVIGFIPERLMAREVGHHAITELVVTQTMFDRKDRMIREADAFVVLPGGLGTLDELFEVVTLRQLGYHQKPLILVNVDGFWDPLLAMAARVIEEGFADPDTLAMMQVVDAVEALLPALGLLDPEPSQAAARS